MFRPHRCPCPSLLRSLSWFRRPFTKGARRHTFAICLSMFLMCLATFLTEWVTHVLHFPPLWFVHAFTHLLHAAAAIPFIWSAEPLWRILTASTPH